MRGRILVALLLACGTARAEEGAFMRAVSFALTGQDGTPIVVEDKTDCVFSISDRGEWKDSKETFHLNNIDPARIVIEPFTTTFKDGRTPDYFVDISVFGEGVVWELNGPDKHKYVHLDGTIEYFNTLPHYEANTHQIRLGTREYERVVRAWKYIYAHGCAGRKSSF